MSRLTKSPLRTSMAGSSFLRFALKGQKDRMALKWRPEVPGGSESEEQCSCMVSGIYAMLDEREEALDWLEHAVPRFHQLPVS